MIDNDNSCPDADLGRTRLGHGDHLSRRSQVHLHGRDQLGRMSERSMDTTRGSGILCPSGCRGYILRSVGNLIP